MVFITFAGISHVGQTHPPFQGAITKGRIDFACSMRYNHFILSFKNFIIYFIHIKSLNIFHFLLNYSSFTEYLDCSEQAARKTCGEETAQFTRGFLDKMSSTLVKVNPDNILFRTKPVEMKNGAHMHDCLDTVPGKVLISFI